MRRLFNSKREWLAVPLCLNKLVNGKTFYHFFFAILLPLLNLARRGIFDKSTVRLVSCDIFNPILEEISKRGIVDIYIEPDQEMAAMNAKNRRIPSFYLESMEAYFHLGNGWAPRPGAVDGSILKEIAKFTLPFFPGKEKNVHVMIINRANDEALRGKNHGATTRAFPNAKELRDRLTSDGLTTRLVSLEGATLSEQIALFRSARVVIAQHGSSLANLVWSYPSTKVIEFVPRNFTNFYWRYFDILCGELELDRTEVVQGGPFAPIDLDLISKMLQNHRF